MLLRVLAAVGLLATSALADGAAIVNALATIQGNTAQLNTTIVQWGGKIQGYNRIDRQSDITLASINDATKTATASKPLTSDEAINIAIATFPLIDDLNVTLINFIAAQPKFAKLCKLPDALAALKEQQAASNKFSAAVLKKVPEGLQVAAQQVVAPINQDFGVAVSNYTAAVAQIKKNPHWKGWNGKWTYDKSCPGKPPSYGYGYGGKPTQY